jgi:L-threonylcarbamoyladenylate synthase
MIKDIQNSLKVLKKGGMILYPTDTIWGIGCDATNPEAVDQIFRIKKRSDTKSLLVLLDNPERLSDYVKEIPEIAWDLIKVSDQPLTIVYPGGINLASNILHSDGSVGIRVTGDIFCKELIRQLGKPIISTSANISGEPSPSIFTDISEKIKSSVDYIVKWRQDDTARKTPSSVIKLGVKGEIDIIRSGYNSRILPDPDTEASILGFPA